MKSTKKFFFNDRYGYLNGWTYEEENESCDLLFCAIFEDWLKRFALKDSGLPKLKNRRIDEIWGKELTGRISMMSEFECLVQPICWIFLLSAMLSVPSWFLA